MPTSYVDDIVSVVDDEARHFLSVMERLEHLGVAYGELPVHELLWCALSCLRVCSLSRANVFLSALSPSLSLSLALCLSSNVFLLSSLWSCRKNARVTQHDLAARLALVPLVQEARGLDAG